MKHLYWKSCLVLTLSIFTMIGNVVMLFLLYPRIKDSNFWGFDYIGAVVGVLSLLTTVLIGWNIFYALNMKEELFKRIEETQRDTTKSLREHSQANEKEFHNIVETFKRTENYCKKLDDTIIKLIMYIYTNGKQEMTVSDAKEQLEKVWEAIKNKKEEKSNK